MGKTQRAVSDLFSQSIAEAAAAGPTIVLLDEVETLAADRSKMSLEANPDRHPPRYRRGAGSARHARRTVIPICCSSPPATSRRRSTARSPRGAISSCRFPCPTARPAPRILKDCLTGLGRTYSRRSGSCRIDAIRGCAAECVGLDGRAIRKMVANALASNPQTAMNPEQVTIEDLLAAARAAKAATHVTEARGNEHRRQPHLRKHARSVTPLQTWTAIVDLLTLGSSRARGLELLAVAGVAASIIAEQAPKDAAIVVTCDGPRTRIYCLYDDDAVDGSDANEDALGFDPLQGRLARVASLPQGRSRLGAERAEEAQQHGSPRATSTPRVSERRTPLRDEIPGSRLRSERISRLMTSVAVNTYTHSVTYVADNILKSIQGHHSPERARSERTCRELGKQDARRSRHGSHTGDLEAVVLEIFDPKTGALIVRWDIDVVYSWSSGDGSFWTDTEQLRYAIRKAGVAPSEASYRFSCKPNRADQMWLAGRRQHIAPPTAWCGRASAPPIEHNGLGGNTAYLEENLMLTVDEAFRKFKSRLELNDKEQKNASARHYEVRDYLDDEVRDRPQLPDRLICAPHQDETAQGHRHLFRAEGIREALSVEGAIGGHLTDFHDALVEKYGDKAMRKQCRSVNVDFGVYIDAEDNTDYRVVSVDVVPAFAESDDYEIPDNDTGKWIKTNPEIHAEKATAAHQAFSNEWKGLVRMVKYWNNNPGTARSPLSRRS